MKTIKTILVAITVAFTFYACSESIYYPPESENNKYLYTLEGKVKGNDRFFSDGLL